MKRFRAKLDILLTGIITLLMASCQSHKQNVRPRPSEMICMYGIPPEVYEKIHSDTTAHDVEKPIQTTEVKSEE